ncbi:MAG TPA: hypothetical protein VLC28_09565 [Flavitalea sp.]|nr:hypothetical protein [Flavitalea sp.]
MTESQVPDQHTGAETNTAYSYDAKNIEQAIAKFDLVKQRLLDINHWQDYAGTATASFELTDERGKPTNDKVREGFYFKIDIPGPGSKAGRGYDWVRVEYVAEEGHESSDSQSMMIRVRPSDNPTTNEDDTAHFYSSEATSNFIVKREGNKITAAVHGRNEKPNTETERVLDKTRNAAVGATAAAGISTIQWNLLVKGLIRESE